jgi:hypothetical protein
VRLRPSAVGSAPTLRSTSPAARFSGAALALGLMVTGIATATPAGAGEPIRVDLHKLRICESGNNYHLNTGNGYYGAYQFSRSTWRGLGFRGLPSHARHAMQDRAAKKLHRVQGWAAWPSCSHTEHLR